MFYMSKIPGVTPFRQEQNWKSMVSHGEEHGKSLENIGLWGLMQIVVETRGIDAVD